MLDSHFENPHGLDSPGHYSTARDLGKLASYAMCNPIFAQTVSTKTVTLGQRVLQNHNKLLWQVEGADGVKTGYTKAAGRILVSSATRQGRRLVVVTINDSNDWADHKALLEIGFRDYTPCQLVQKGQCIGYVDVVGGQSQQVALLAAEDFSYAMAPGEQVTFSLPSTGFVYAPVCAHEKAGYGHVLVDGRPVGKVELVYGSTVEQEENNEKSFWDKLFRKDR